MIYYLSLIIYLEIKTIKLLMYKYKCRISIDKILTWRKMLIIYEKN